MGEKIKRPEISVVMSIYRNDVPEYVAKALDSICYQTVKPVEIVLVGDGPISVELEDVVIAKQALAIEKGIAFKYLPQKENRGLGEAMRIAVEAAHCNYIARMDSDDIALSHRFEKEITCLEENPDLAVVGGMISEFVDTPEHIVNRRILPLEDGDIKRFMQSRCGVNHVTVIFRKSELMRVGNYNADYGQEDYYLWARMMKAGCKFMNIPDVVVNVRSGISQFARRGGWRYFEDHMEIFKLMYKWHLISLPVLLKNYLLRFAQVTFPAGLRTWIYQHVLRK